MMARKSGIVIPNRIRWHQRLAIGAVAWLARLIIFSWRCQWEDPRHGEKPDNAPVIFCIWHNRLSLAIAIWEKMVRPAWPDHGIAALISASKDGAWLADIVGRFGIKTIRGSSSRRGAQALLEATTWIEKNYSIAITPDGPRGPCYKIQPGIIQLAQVTGRPIVPVGSEIQSKIRFKSWDRFQVPLPFSRCNVRFGNPLYIPREADDAQREALRQELERTMMAINTD